jgi:hypothetical protein
MPQAGADRAAIAARHPGRGTPPWCAPAAVGEDLLSMGRSFRPGWPARAGRWHWLPVPATATSSTAPQPARRNSSPGRRQKSAPLEGSGLAFS